MGKKNAIFIQFVILEFSLFTESADESDCSECSANLQRKHDGENNQPDSGFEEKKVIHRLFFFSVGFQSIKLTKFVYTYKIKCVSPKNANEYNESKSVTHIFVASTPLSMRSLV